MIIIHLVGVIGKKSTEKLKIFDSNQKGKRMHQNRSINVFQNRLNKRNIDI